MKNLKRATAAMAVTTALVAALAGCPATSDPGATGATDPAVQHPSDGASTYHSIYDSPSPGESTYDSIYNTPESGSDNAPIPQADAVPQHHHLGSPVCTDSMYPTISGIRVIYSQGTYVIVGEVDVWCSTPLLLHQLYLTVTRLDDGHQWKSYTELIPNRDANHPAIYAMKVPCTGGAYAFSYVAKVETYRGDTSNYGNIGESVQVQPHDCT
jgi:hypothetical protein